MALVVKDRVKETTTSTGTGTITLAGATQGYQSFSVIGDGNTTYYTITNGTDWEVGLGTYTATGTTLSRDTILESSNSGSAVNFSAGVKDVFVTYPAEKAVTLDGTETLTRKTIDGSNNTITNVSLTTGITGTLAVANGGTGTSSLTSGYLVKGNGTSAVSASVIYDSGTNVGVGTSSPSAKLEVSGSVRFVDSSAAGPDLLFGNIGGSTAINNVANARNYYGAFEHIFTNFDNTAERMRITSAGLVGIGTSSPDKALTISASDSQIRLYDADGTNQFASFQSDNGTAKITSRDNTSNGTIAFQRFDGTTVSESMRITSAGRVGIGTTAPNQLLEVRNLSGDARVGIRSIDTGIAALMLGDDTNGNASYVSYNNADNALSFGTTSNERMRIDSSGRVGIGTSSPALPLVVSNANAGGFEINHSGGIGNGTYLQSYNRTTAAYIHNTNYALSHTWYADATRAMDLDSSGNVGIGVVPIANTRLYVRTAAITDTAYYADNGSNSGFTVKFASSLTSIGNDFGSPLAFLTTNTERMRIDSSGNVGIGTSSPAVKLEVSGGIGDVIAGNAQVFARSGDNTNFNQVRIRATATESRLESLAAGTGTSSPLVFHTGGSERMRIDSSGRVGVGTSSPDSKVDIEAANSQLRLTDSDDSKFVEFSYSGGKLITRNNSTTTTTEQFTLDESGRLGVGTISPSQTLQVQGTGYATSDFRAPIFYDSNNTSYYVDPASTSALNSIYAYGVTAIKGGNPLYIEASNSAYQRVDSRVESTNYARAHWYGVTDAGGTSNFRHAWYDGGAYINVTANSSGRIDFTGSAASMYIGSDRVFDDGYHPNADKWTTARTLSLTGDVTGSVSFDGSANASITATVVDDSHNHIYDNIDGLTTNAWGGPRITTASGYIDFGPANTSWAHIYTDRPAFYFNVSTSADVAVGRTSVNAPIFYDSNNTAYYVDPAATSILSGADFDGIVRIATGSVGPANTTDGLMFDGNYTNGQYRHRFRKRDDSGGIPLYLDYAAGTANSYTELMKFGPNTADGSYLTVYGIVATNTDMRSPIYYDSSNTGYYVDPASGSRLGGQVLFDGGSSVQGNGDFVARRSSGSIGVYYFVDANDKYLYWDGSAYSFGGSYTTNGYRFTASGDIRAPIFYDSDNTGFFTNPASSSTMYEIAVTNTIYSSNWFRSYNSTGWYNQTYGGGIFMQDSTWVRVYNNKQFYSENFIQSGSSVRAPIFYDSNNTAYYLDPHTSGASIVVNGYMLGGFGASSTSGTLDWNDTSNVRSGSTGTLLLGTATNGMGGSIYYHPFNFEYSSKDGSGNVTQMAIAYGSPGNKLWMRGRYSGSWTSWVEFLNTGADGQTKSGILQSDSSLRAPIFYDSGNTAYYVDAASTSQLNALTLASNLTVNNGNIYGPQYINMRYGASGGGGVRLYDSDGTIHSYWYGDGSGRGGLLDNNAHWAVKIGIGTEGLRLYCDNNEEFIVNTDHTLSPGSSRAPIFYDSNNTAYYIDPASTTSASFASTVQFANTTQSKLNLYSTSYQIGVQANTQYYRAGTRFSWFRGGSHNNNENNPGTGGTVAMTLDGSSNLTVTGNVTAYSDIRIKDNVEQISGALDRVSAIRGVTYTRNDLEDKERRYAGVIAQEIEKVLPEAIFESDDRKAVDYNATIGLLIEAIKELKAEVETLKKG